LNGLEPARGAYVLYWMQASQRERFNPALETAVALANARREPVVVAFELMDDYPDANERHYAFLLEGLAETRRALLDRGIGFTMRRGHPDEVAIALGRDASVVVCDRCYLRFQKAWRARVAKEVPAQVIEVEGDVVVPVETASTKAEVAARTLRPKIGRQLECFLVPLEPVAPALDGRGAAPDSDQDLEDLPALLASMKIDRSVPPVPRFFRGGTAEAVRRLGLFVDEKLGRYAAGRSEPGRGIGSTMSPYLQFGQISPVEIALAVRAAMEAPPAEKDAYVEELVVRRELAVNWAHFTLDYDSFDALPAWARATLAAHAGDRREHLYDRAALEEGRTHDPYFNAAQHEMLRTGFMHNHMRMYWGKQILAFSRSPREAHEITMAINNRHLLDGRNANSYTNIGWVYGLHDRPFAERPVFGQVRSMTAGGLDRKFDMRAYLEWVDALDGGPAAGKTLL